MPGRSLLERAPTATGSKRAEALVPDHARRTAALLAKVLSGACFGPAHAPKGFRLRPAQPSRM